MMSYNLLFPVTTTNTYMKVEKVYAVGFDTNSYRYGELAEIIGVSMNTPIASSTPRLCYNVVYSDGEGDSIPLSEIGNTVAIVTLDEVTMDLVGGKFEFIRKLEQIYRKK